jgi:uncharacterized protein YndB with AHSA1/START domain
VVNANPVEVVEREVRIAARPETVFGFFTDPVRMLRWKGIEAELDPRPGGTYRVQINAQAIVRGQFVAVEPHRRVVFTWGWEGEGQPVPPGSSTVEVTLTPDGDETILRLTHRGLPAELRDVHGHGWDHFLSRLATAAAGGDPGPDPMASAENMA